jgi:hypothetical protein
MTLVVQWWFFVPFGKRGRVLHSLPVNHPQCPFIQMTDTNVTFLSCYNTVGHTRCEYVRHDTVTVSYLPSIPAALQTRGRVEYATIHVVAPPDSRIATPLSLTLFSQRLLDVQKFDSERFHQSSHHH